MDSNAHSDNSQNLSSASRKRPRENETPSQKLKREKAAERQRRKRERDRNAAGMGIMAFPPPGDHQQQHQPPPPPPPEISSQDLTPEEAARRDRVRAAARERQRKHRQLVKQRKMRELGLDMGNEIMPGMEEVHYRVNADGQYQQVLPQDLQQQQQQIQQHAHAMGHHEPPFPQGQPLGGQTFASTLLLSFSCAPLLKQHLLRTLSMTNEELASLEPTIAEAWDHWDHQRRMHYAEQQAAKGGPGPNNVPGSSYPVDMNHGPNSTSSTNPSNRSFPTQGGPSGPSSDPSHSTPNEFRARFHRPLVAPTPFRTYNADTQTTATTSTPTSASGSGHGPPSDPIDPHLGGAPNGNAAKGESHHDPNSASVDPDLDQGKGGAEVVVGRSGR